MRLKKEIKIKILNHEIKNSHKIQLNPVLGLKKSQGKRISKYQLKNLNKFIFEKDNLKFPLNLNNDYNSLDSNFVYLKDKNFHFIKNSRLFTTPILSFKNLSNLLTVSPFLRLLKKD